VFIWLLNKGCLYYLEYEVSNSDLTHMVRIQGNSRNNVLRGTRENDLLYGFGGNDRLEGLGGNDFLDGGTGQDVLIGGTSNDVYIVDNVKDRVIERANQGIDTVRSSVSFRLSSNVEHLTLTGTQRTTGVGNNLNNQIAGNAGNNVLRGLEGNDRLIGGAGNDFLDGGTGQDVLIGGTGNDVYIVDNVKDVVIERANQGIDTVRSSVSFRLSSNVEHLALAGTQGTTGVGNNLNNQIAGNAGNNVLRGLEGNDRLIGGAGNDFLDGGTGQDVLIGGIGNDVYIVDDIGDRVVEETNQGIDTVRSSINYTLSSNVENLILMGTQNLDGRGNNLVNTITGNSGNNVLDGSAGADTLIGGAGDDTYLVDDIGDITIERENGGIDRVRTALADYELAEHIEYLEFTGTRNSNGTGNNQNNTIIGNVGDNTLDGAGGADTLIGGLGSDTYIVSDAGDIVIERAGEGTDLVRSSLADYTLADQVENLELLAGAINGTGNNLANTIIGNVADNILSGGAGDDTLVGGAGNDTLIGGLGVDMLTGGAGIDTFALVDTGRDIITDFNSGEDIIDLSQTAFGLVGQAVSSVLDASRLVVVNTDNLALEGATGIISNLLFGETRLIFSTESGKLFYDANGTTLGAANGLGEAGGLIATLSTAAGTVPTLTNTSFLISSLV
jgi:Ca2+-binding RTX toxin-like protein